jgi:hypothetical protein
MEMGCVKIDVTVNGIGSIALCRPQNSFHFCLNGRLSSLVIRVPLQIEFIRFWENEPKLKNHLDRVLRPQA